MTERTNSLIRQTFIPGVTPPPSHQDEAYWFAFRGDRMLVFEGEGEVGVPLVSELAQLGLTVASRHYLGCLEGVDCFSAGLPKGVDLPPGMALENLRRLYGLIDEDLFWVASRAVQIVEWDRSHQYCSHCGAPVEDGEGERVKVCTVCDRTYYPRLAPAIIVAVTRGDRLLLARSHRHPPGMFSVLAGFVEPGETLEGCLVREVREEVGIEVSDIRYFGSQPWPFPHSLMIAFTCRYAGGTLTLDETEMAEAGWYRADELPKIPPSISIARRLIDWFVVTQNGGVG